MIVKFICSIYQSVNEVKIARFCAREKRSEYARVRSCLSDRVRLSCKQAHQVRNLNELRHQMTDNSVNKMKFSNTNTRMMLGRITKIYQKGKKCMRTWIMYIHGSTADSIFCYVRVLSLENIAFLHFVFVLYTINAKWAHPSAHLLRVQ